MAVIIGELEHFAAPAGSRERGVGGAQPEGVESTAPTAAEIIQALRREADRRARLWAD